jgi:hypothetical protein
VAWVRDGVTSQLAKQTMGELSSHPIAYDTGFTLPPGTCKPKFPTRENETGNAGTYETSYSP